MPNSTNLSQLLKAEQLVSSCLDALERYCEAIEHGESACTIRALREEAARLAKELEEYRCSIIDAVPSDSH